MYGDTCPPGQPNPEEIEALYPPGSTPEVRFDRLSSLCSYGVTPLVMQGALRQVLIQHFGDTQNILNSTLRNRLDRDGAWRADARTGLVIESLHRWQPENSEKRPSLILKEGAWKWMRVGIGDRMQTDYRSGRQYFGGHWNGSHTIFAVANEGAEAQILGIEAMKCFTFFASEITEQLGLMRFMPVSIGEVAALEESAEHYVVPIVVAYVVEELWYTQPDSPRLKSIVWRTSQTLPTY